MFRRNWRDREFWAWWWESALSPRLRSGAAVGSFILLGAAGAYSALELSSANTVSSKNVTVWETTVVRSATAGPKTVPSSARRVRVVVRYVRGKPVGGHTQTTVVSVKRVVTDHDVVTRSVTAERTVTRLIPRLATRTQTVAETTPPVTVTAPAVTQTETLPAETVFVTVTVKQHGHP